MGARSGVLLERLKALPQKIDLSLERMRVLLQRLGCPQDRLPPVFHVAGTNGKGSTCAFLRAILEAAGYRVHVYTSPHLVRLEERFRLAGSLVEENVLCEALDAVLRANGEHATTVFEILTATAFMLFAEHPADAVLMEVGLGGRLDATNLVTPLVSVITPIGLDHREFLGDTVAAIAAEKAGIIKPQGVVVSAAQAEDARVVLVREAARAHANLFMADEHWHIMEEQGSLIYTDDAGLLQLPLPRLHGAYQHINAGTAVAALRAQSALPVPEHAYVEGLQKAQWPARLQHLHKGFLPSLLSPLDEIWLDGAHNADGASALAAALADLEERSPKPLHIVLGALTTKDAEALLRPLQGLARGIWCVTIPDEPKAYDATTLSQVAGNMGFVSLAVDNVPHALTAIRGLSDDSVRVVIMGSLYLCGHVLALNGTPPT